MPQLPSGEDQQRGVIRQIRVADRPGKPARPTESITPAERQREQQQPRPTTRRWIAMLAKGVGGRVSREDARVNAFESGPVNDSMIGRRARRLAVLRRPREGPA